MTVWTTQHGGLVIEGHSKEGALRRYRNAVARMEPCIVTKDGVEWDIEADCPQAEIDALARDLIDELRREDA